MHLFQMPEYIPKDPQQIEATMPFFTDLAERYWRGESSDDLFVEILCDGLTVTGWGPAGGQPDEIGSP